MKVTIDPDLCEGNAKCVKACPEVFALGDDDRSYLLCEPAEELRAKVQEAARLCPRQAISIAD